MQELLICVNQDLIYTKPCKKHLHSPDSDSKTFVILIFANVKIPKNKEFLAISPI